MLFSNNALHDLLVGAGLLHVAVAMGGRSVPAARALARASLTLAWLAKLILAIVSHMGRGNSLVALGKWAWALRLETESSLEKSQSIDSA